MFDLMTRPRRRAWPVVDTRELDRLFDGFFTGFPVVTQEGAATAAYRPRVDLAETETEVTVSVELPGMEKKDIAVELDDEVVTIRGERKDEQEEEDKQWYRKEQRYGSFERSIALPAAVEADKAKASFKNGVLSVTVPKQKEEEPERKTLTIEG